ncbi:hypothetical protein E2C01_020468 [Portunus trituberculatus]|uniref:Uncharacterized protein n=1 Tax=Portunus trituberculatus TaxID=210409 RepID=A0A5B7E069_PORTR|nr:hypothetical protein [Portunus trituberculatus]
MNCHYHKPASIRVHYPQVYLSVFPCVPFLWFLLHTSDSSPQLPATVSLPIAWQDIIYEVECKPSPSLPPPQASECAGHT